MNVEVVSAHNDRKVWLDATKGFCILLVLISHSGGIPHIGKYLLACYMPLFFVVSGFTLKKEPYKNFIKKKIKRLMIPYWVYGIILVTVSIITQVIKKTYSIHTLILGYGGLLYSRYCIFPVNIENNIAFFQIFTSPFWFLGTLFFAYMISYLCIEMKLTTKILYCFILIILTVLLSLAPILLPWSMDLWFVAALFLIVGLTLAKSDLLNISKKKLAILLVGGSIIYVSLVYINGDINMSVRVLGDKGIFSIILFIVIGIIGSVIYCGLFKILEYTLFSKLLSKIGQNTIVLLCTHLIVFQCISEILSGYNLGFYLMQIIKVLSAVVISFYIRFLLRKIETKLPFVRYLM